MDAMRRDQAELGVRNLLMALGENPDREGLRETPRRVRAFLDGFCSPEPFAFTTFENEGMSEMVVEAGIEFFSLCEHHMLPFFGEAVVAYVPGERIAGLSKLARAVRHCAAGLQTQERIAKTVADILEEKLRPLGVGVVLRARHLCMEMRGVQAHGVHTTTSQLRGVLFEKPEARAEFLALARGL